MRPHGGLEAAPGGTVAPPGLAGAALPDLRGRLSFSPSVSLRCRPLLRRHGGPARQPRAGHLPPARLSPPPVAAVPSTGMGARGGNSAGSAAAGLLPARARAAV